MKINFIEDKPYVSSYGLGSQGEFTPVYVKLGKTKRFFINKVKQLSGDSYDWMNSHNKRNLEEYEERKENLIKHNGKYVVMNVTRFDNPYDLIEWVKENNYTFEVVREFFRTSDSGDFTDFHGNLNEYSCSFHYRIYDDAMLNDLKNIISDMKQNIR